MASTFRTIVNRLLRLHGEQEIADDSTFNTNASLTKLQLQAKEWFALCHQWIMATPRSRFLLRDFTFNTSNGVNSYSLDSTTNYERILEQSFFITTAGSEYGPLEYVDLMRYRNEFSAGPETSTGRPTRWFLHFRAAGETVDKVGFSPIPGATYAIRYSAFRKPYVLSAATDTIAFEAEWEHPVLLWGGTFLEMAKAEGKAMDYGQFIQEVKSELEAHTIPVPDEGIRLDVPISIFGRRTDAWETGESWD